MPSPSWPFIFYHLEKSGGSTLRPHIAENGLKVSGYPRRFPILVFGSLPYHHIIVLCDHRGTYLSSCRAMMTMG